MNNFCIITDTQIVTPTWEEGHKGDTAEVHRILKGMEKVGSEWLLAISHSTSPKWYQVEASNGSLRKLFFHLLSNRACS